MGGEREEEMVGLGKESLWGDKVRKAQCGANRERGGGWMEGRVGGNTGGCLEKGREMEIESEKRDGNVEIGKKGKSDRSR